ncbi:ATP-binding protein [Actinomadura fibrosa]|uniref:AAA family ATPase n=1 Tax=Actinomadura fibrosa TaxID=111802 RepID=A0ABW2XTN2_9ACTN|nr:ATP-binding protein [Actinomadura fibrosa]
MSDVSAAARPRECAVPAEPFRGQWLRDTYALTDAEMGVTALALEPEVTGRARPTVADALASVPGAERRHFQGDAPLISERIVALLGDGPLIARRMALDEQIADVLLGQNGLDRRLVPFCTLTSPPPSLWAEAPLPDERRAALLVAVQAAWGRRLRLHFDGPRGSGRRTTARALAGRLGVPLLTVDAPPGPDLMFHVLREASLHGALLYAPDDLADEVRGYPGVAVTAGAGPLPGPPGDTVEVSFARPCYEVRHRVWTVRLAAAGMDAAPAAELAARFRFGPDRIGGAVAAAAATWAVERAMRPPQSGQPDPDDPTGPDGTAGPGRAELFAAARAQTGHELAALARRIEPLNGWDDLVLPADGLGQLRELCAQVTGRRTVWRDWGFADKASRGRGVTALFTGPPGTGKTMAAEVVAGELGLDLYTIDLSSVVSKYIGETEKNLEKVLAAAGDADAVLLFDEADALFGRRGEVRDARDRYANVETSYLLQRLEQYDGIALLATNLRRHLDPAFTRRLGFVVDFPLPGEAERRLIWERSLPARAPRGDDLDLSALAGEFPLTGGEIRNVVLRAAFAAAAAGQPIGQGDVLEAIRREHRKTGRVTPAAGEA